MFDHLVSYVEFHTTVSDSLPVTRVPEYSQQFHSPLWNSEFSFCSRVF